MTQIAIALSDREIERCFPVMHHLRSHLVASEFVNRVRHQEPQGYRLAYLMVEDQIKAAAGFRVGDCLAWGKFLYVDDLVTLPDERSKGYGEQIFQWLVAYAQAQGCQQFHLDSGVHRSEAHRFYFKQRMSINSFHFGLTLP